MKVNQIMSRNPITASLSTPFESVWKLIFEKRISGLPIVTKQNELIGIISEEDLIEKLFPSYEEYFFDPWSSKNFEDMEYSSTDITHLRAGDIMNKNVTTTSGDFPVMKAASTMLVKNVNCLPVVKLSRGKKILIGIICKGDIFEYLFKKHLSAKSRRLS